MKETKHTPGPWNYEGGDNASCEVNAGNTTISIPRWDKNTGVHIIDRDEMEANAKIIAAAPELLDACLTVVNGYEGDGMEGMSTRDHVSYRYCKAAIKKATL